MKILNVNYCIRSKEGGEREERKRESERDRDGGRERR